MLSLLSSWLIPAAIAQAPATLEGQVVDEETAAPIANATVQAMRGEKVVAEARTDPAGHFKLELSEGIFDVRVVHDDYPPHVVEERLEAGERAKVRYRIHGVSGAQITITDEKTTAEAFRTVVTVDELRSIPGSFGDPVRALQTLPGVARPNVLEGTLVVRGAEGINTGYYLDGMPVPYMFHTLVGRSIMSPSFIDDIEFFPGGMPSRFGEVTQAAVNIRTNTKEIGGTKVVLTADFLDGSAALEHKFSDTLSMRVAGRYSWASAFIWTGSAIAMVRAGGKAYEATYLYPAYWDAYADLRWDPTPDDHVSATFIGSRDSLVFREGRVDADGDGKPDPTPDDEYDLPYDPDRWIDNQFLRFRVRWDHSAPDKEATTWVATGPERQTNLLGSWWLSREGPYRGRVSGFSTIARHEVSWQLSDDAALNYGVQTTIRPVVAEDYQDVYEDPEAEIPSTDDVQVLVGAWAEPQIKMGRWYLAPGIRGAWYAWSDELAAYPEPRLTVRYALNDFWSLKAAGGRYTQMPPIERYAQGIGNPKLPIMKAWQLSAGAEGALGGGWTFDGSVYGAYMEDLIVRDLEMNIYQDADEAYEELRPVFRNVTGVAYGVEAMARLRPDTFPVWGWAALTLGQALRYDGERWFPGDYDQPISLTLLAAWDLPKDWQISGRWRYTSGHPFTPYSGVYNPTWEYYEALPGELNSDRYKNFRQLDLRVQKTRTKRRVEWVYYLDVFNATWRVNPIAAFYDYDYTEMVPIIHLPILPTAGVEAHF